MAQRALDPKKVRRIRSLAKKGYPPKEIAARVGCAFKTVYKYMERDTKPPKKRTKKKTAKRKTTKKTKASKAKAAASASGLDEQLVRKTFTKILDERYDAKLSIKELCRLVDRQLEDPDLPELVVEGNALDQARQLYRHTLATMSSLAASSPRLGPARAEARAQLKLLNTLERERQEAETPDEQKRRLRREDGETRKRIMQYVVQYERAAAKPTPAAPFGKCIHCDQPLPAPIPGAAA